MSLALIAAAKILAGLAGFATGIASGASYSGTFPPWIHAVLVGTFAGAGGLLVVGGRRDERARLLGTLYLVLGSTFTFRLFAAAAARTDLPAGVSGAALLLSAVQPEAFAPWLLWKFVARFPSAAAPPRIERLMRVALGVALACGAILFLGNLLARLASRVHPLLVTLLSRLDRDGAASVFWPVEILLILPAFAFMFLRVPAAGPREQRRVRLFTASLAGGATPMLIDVIAEALIPPFQAFMSQPGARLASGLVAYPALLSVPFTTGYAVIVERVLDVRVVIRKAVQYAIVKLTAAALLVLPIGGLAWLVYRQRNRTLGSLVAGDVVWLLAGTAILFGIYRARRPMFDAIDRHFFREQYDARTILAGLAMQVREVSDLPELARLLRVEIERALHPDQVAVLARDIVSEALVSPDGAWAPLASSSTVALLCSASNEPFDVDLERDQAVLRRLPEAERAWLAGMGARLIVPLRAAGGRLLGLIVLGGKKSEQPFSREDRSLLSAAAADASLALENWMLRKASGEGTREDSGHTTLPGDFGSAAGEECAVCGTVQAGEPQCRVCGGRVGPSAIPVTLGTKFTVQRRIGSGGMGVVYLGTDVALGRAVALKTLPRLSPRSVEGLRREARAMAAVDHPNLAVIHGLETWKDVPILVCEFFGGGTLADRLRSGRLRPADVGRVGSVLADALTHLHRSGLLHRDIKPSNIGFTWHGVPKLFDFGLARMLEERVGAGGQDERTTHLPEPNDRSSAWELDLAELGGVTGTAAYLSPEATLGAAARPSLDVWALALTLYEALTGWHPFLSDSVGGVLQAIRETDVPDARIRCPDCPAPLAELLAACLVRARDDRVRKASVLADGLKRITFDRPAPAT